MTTIATLICAFAFVACDDTDSSSSFEKTTLVMNKCYIHEDYVRKETTEQRFYVFHSDGTGEVTYHWDYDYTGDSYESHYHRHYIIHFKYTYVDNDKSAVVCFYDSMERLEGDDGGYTTDTTWSTLISVSKNVLATVETDYVFWINEDYLKTLSHFGEEQTA